MMKKRLMTTLHIRHKLLHALRNQATKVSTLKTIELKNIQGFIRYN